MVGYWGPLQDLVQFIKEHADECGIIYARLRATCDWLASALNSEEIEASAYHAGMDTATRHRTQAEWSDGSCNIVVATVAFGMGIDKADVRWVVHWNAATSLEGFYQESGRAGRDGQPSVSVLYSSHAELQMLSGQRSSVSAMASYAMVRLDTLSGKLLAAKSWAHLLASTQAYAFCHCRQVIQSVTVFTFQVF